MMDDFLYNEAQPHTADAIMRKCPTGSSNPVGQSAREGAPLKRSNRLSLSTAVMTAHTLLASTAFLAGEKQSKVFATPL